MLWVETANLPPVGAVLAFLIITARPTEGSAEHSTKRSRPRQGLQSEVCYDNLYPLTSEFLLDVLSQMAQ